MPRCRGAHARVTSFWLTSTDSIQAFCNQSWSHFWTVKRLKCSLAVRKNKDSLMFVTPSYIFTCTLKNGIYFGLKNRGIYEYTKTDATASAWSYAINTRPCPWVSPGTIYYDRDVCDVWQPPDDDSIFVETCRGVVQFLIQTVLLLCISWC
jgi:hypothetical protein